MVSEECLCRRERGGLLVKTFAEAILNKPAVPQGAAGLLFPLPPKFRNMCYFFGILYKLLQNKT